MNIKTGLILFVLCFNTLLFAQPRLVREANRKFRNENYCEAVGECIAAYTQLARKGAFAIRIKGDMAFKVAECYRRTDKYKEALPWYDKAIILRYYEVEPLVYYYYGESLRNSNEYKKAQEYYKLYKNIVPNDGLADAGINSCLQHEKFKENRTRERVININQLNKEGHEISPSFIDKKGSKLAFSSTSYDVVGSAKDPRSCQPFLDIFVSEIDKKGNWTKPKPIQGDGINTEDNEGTVCIDARGKTLFFTRCPQVAKMNLGCEIWMSEVRGSGWGRPIELEELKPNDTVSIGHPCVSDDGKFLIFVSDWQGPGSKGGKDLWYSTYDKKSEKWSTPVNLGPEINTAGNELFPTFAENGDLMFSTDGITGMGGLDIFRAKKVDGQMKWENPKNLGAPINSDFNDCGLIEAGPRKGYFSSNRKGSKGDQNLYDLYEYELPIPSCEASISVFNQLDKKNKLNGVAVTITQESDNKVILDTVISEFGKISLTRKNESGNPLSAKQVYKIKTGPLAGYFDDEKETIINTDVCDTAGQFFVIEIGRLPNKPIRLPEVRYPTAEWTFVNDGTINSNDSLQYVYDVLVENPTVVLELSSHTDYRGSDKLNQALSENRAKACYNYLVDKGIDPRRIVPVGKGEASPARIKDENGNDIVLSQAYIEQFKRTDPAKYEALLQLNRRTEGKVLSKDFNAETAPPANPAYRVYKPLR